MKIVVLMENTTTSPKYKAKHGLSIYVETNKHKLLFDIGSNNFF